MKRILKRILAVLVVAMVAIQFVRRPDRSVPEFDRTATLAARFAPPEGVERLLRTCCYDCHSYETRWPWYSRVAPFSWLIAHDIVEGREAMNFSTIGAEDPDDQREMLKECAREVKRGKMPLDIYTTIHKDAILSDAQRDELDDWFRDAAKRAR